MSSTATIARRQLEASAAASSEISRERRLEMRGALRVFLTGCSARDEKELFSILKETCAEPSIELLRDIDQITERFAKEAPDLVLACEGGCEPTAWSVLKAAGELAPRTAVIVFSHATTETSAMRAIDLGAADFVQIDRRWEVSVAIRRALREYEQRQRRKEAEDRLRNHINLLQLQQVVATAANEALSPRDAAESVLDISRAYGNFALAHLHYAPLEEVGRVNSSEVWSGFDEERYGAFREQTKLMEQEGMGGMVEVTLRKKELTWIPDTSAEPRFIRGPVAAACGLRGAVMIPVATGTDVVGVIEFFSAVPVPRDERLALVLEYVATQLGRVFERDRAERRLEHRAREQAVLAELSRKAVDVVNLDEFLLATVRRVEEVLPDCRCAILEATPDARALRIRALSDEAATKYPPGKTFPAEQESDIGYAVLHADSLKIDLSAPHSYQLPDFLEGLTCTGITASIRLRNDLFGAVVAYSNRRKEFSRGENTFLRSVANVLATAAEHSAAFHQLQLLGSAVTQSQDSIMITDAELGDDGPQILFVNPAFTQITGYSMSEALGRTPRILQGKKTCPDFLETMRNRLREGKSAHGETINYRKDGSEFWVEMLVSPLRNPAGNVTHFVAIQRDITQRKNAEQRLRESEEMLGSAQRVAHLGSWVIEYSDSQDGRLVWSDEVYRIFGIPSIGQEISMESFFNAVHADDREKVSQRYEAAMASRTEYQIDHRVIRPDGVQRIVHEQATGVYDAAGNLVKVNGTVQDITERKQGEEELRHWKDRYDMLSRASGQLIFDWDVKTGKRTNGGDIERLLGCPAEALGDTIEDWISHIHPEDRGHFEKELDRQTAAKGKAEMEYRLRRADGVYITVKGIGYPLLDENGGIERIIGSVADISSQRALEAQLRRSQKMEAFGKLAGGVAHDFNNLLTIITGYIEVLLSEMQVHDPNREYIEEIARAANRASALTGQLLAFSRQQKMQPRVVNLNDCLRDTSKMLARLIGEDIEMKIVPADDLGNVKADVGQIEQVIMNLTVNARDAMPGGGCISMRSRNFRIEKGKEAPANLSAGDYILLEVSDTGTGMSPDVQARIFEPFFTTKAPGHGTGLGLATCYGIVKQSGGEIAVKSKLGAGTTFQIFLPRVYEVVKPYEPTPVATELPTGNQTILVVEDELPVRAIICSILQRLKYTVREAANGTEAMRMLEDPACPHIDLLMTDLVMPEMGGKELIQRAIDQKPEMRMIIISGYPIGPNDALPGNAKFMQKPFTPKALAEAVRDAIAEPIAG